MDRVYAGIFWYVSEPMPEIGAGIKVFVQKEKVLIRSDRLRSDGNPVGFTKN
ncbi:hypothetical protein [Sphingobacterium multivorum]|uniref:hypothetical protein n=2 Tax=Sphingobacteriaceae TaxID=84566 RepID=UPI00289FB876|nr:hypothetical protein [Sphingobacterium multivorum]